MIESSITANISTLIVLALAGLQFTYCTQNQKVTYTFTEFPYKENGKNEQLFIEYETACAQGCSGRLGVSKVLCVRQCISPSCYKDLYQNDLLEEGEVDVRLNSFKGCFIQRQTRNRP